MVCIPCYTIVETAEIVAIERCGKLNRFGLAGCVCFLWPWESYSHKESFRQEVLQVNLHTKTIDNVFVDVSVACNYQINREKIYAAYYMLQDRKQQMTAYIKDGIRTSVCSMTLDAAYAGKEDVSLDLKNHLASVFKEYGINILNVLIREITPDSRVMAAMNQINASKRDLEAAMQRSEGEKVIKIKKAEAEAEAMYLSGEGVARQRKAIMDGLKNSIVDFSARVSDTSPKEVMDLLVLNQYFDTLESIGAAGNMKTVLLSAEVTSSGRSAIMEGFEGVAPRPPRAVVDKH
jgi:regulator of protease activity HflC (stomatin/prohibitin superfamily)